MTQYWITLKIESNDIKERPILWQEEVIGVQTSAEKFLITHPILPVSAQGKTFLRALHNYTALRLGGQEQERDAHQSAASTDIIA